MTIRFLKLPAVIDRRGKKRSAIYLDIADGTFPPGVDLGGGRAKGWPEHEVEAVNAALLSGKSKAEIRTLVLNLLAARNAASSAIAQWTAESEQPMPVVAPIPRAPLIEHAKRVKARRARSLSGAGTSSSSRQ